LLAYSLDKTLERPESRLSVSKGGYKKVGDKLFSRICCDRTKGNGSKLKEGRYRLKIKTKRIIKVVRHWNRLTREVVDAPSLETFKVGLDGALSTLIQL